MPYCDQIWSNFFFGKFWVFNFFGGGEICVLRNFGSIFKQKKSQKICNKLPSVDSYMVVFFPFCFVFSFVFFVFFFLFFCFSVFFSLFFCSFFLVFFPRLCLFFFLVCICFFFLSLFFIFYLSSLFLLPELLVTGEIYCFFSSFNYFCRYLRFYGVDCLGTYFTHIQIWNITRV